MSDTMYFLLSTGGPAEPMDTTGGTNPLSFRGTPVENHFSTLYQIGGVVANVGRLK